VLAQILWRWRLLSLERQHGQLVVHWLPVRQRVLFKIAILIYQYLFGHAPGYLADDCQLVTDASAFHWHEDADCPPNIQLFRRQEYCSCCHMSLEQFAVRLTKRRLVLLPVQLVSEDILFGQPNHGALWTLLPAPCRNILTYYLLTYLLTILTTLENSLLCEFKCILSTMYRKLGYRYHVHLLLTD